MLVGVVSSTLFVCFIVCVSVVCCRVPGVARNVAGQAIFKDKNSCWLLKSFCQKGRFLGSGSVRLWTVVQ